MRHILLFITLLALPFYVSADAGMVHQASAYGVDETAPVFNEAPAVICATSDDIPAAMGVTATDECGAVDLS